jgi:hypothetical protein
VPDTQLLGGRRVPLAVLPSAPPAPQPPISPGSKKRTADALLASALEEAEIEWGKFKNANFMHGDWIPGVRPDDIEEGYAPYAKALRALGRRVLDPLEDRDA